MGPEELIPLAMAAGGALLQKKATDDAADKRKSILNSDAEEQDQLTRKSNANAMETAQQYDPTTRQANEKQAETTAQNSLGTALANAQDPNGLPQMAQGKVSDDYLTTKANATAGELDRAARMTQLFARMRAPTDLRTTEGYALGDLTAKNTGLNQEKQLMHQAYTTDANSVQPDGGLMMAGTLLGAAGSMMGAAGGFGNIGTTGLSGVPAGAAGGMSLSQAKTFGDLFPPGRAASAMFAR